MKFDTENKTAFLKGIFALGIFEDERVMAYAYRIFENPDAQRYFVSQYIKSYISGSLEEFFKKEYRNVYQFFRQAIKNLPKEYSPDNFSDAIRILANDENVVRMKAEIQTINLGIDPFVSPSEFFRQLYEVHRHDLVRTVEATKEAIREEVQEEVAKTKEIKTKTTKVFTKEKPKIVSKTEIVEEKKEAEDFKIPKGLEKRLREKGKEYKNFKSFLQDKEFVDEVLLFIKTPKREKLEEQIGKLEIEREQEVLNHLLKENLSKYPVLKKIFDRSPNARVLLSEAMNIEEKNKIFDLWWNTFNEEEKRQIDELMKKYNFTPSDLIALTEKKFVETLSYSSEFYTMINQWHKNKELENLKTELLDEKEKILKYFYYNVLPIKVVTRKNPAHISYAKRYGQPIMVEGKPEIYTDGIILLEDRNPAEVKKWYEELKKKTSGSERVIDVETIRRAYPQKETKEVKFVAFEELFYPEMVIAHLDAGLEKSIPVDAEYYQWLKKEGYKIKSTGEQEVALVLERNGKDVGLLMPLTQDHSKLIEDLKVKPETKTKSEIKESSPMNLVVSPTFKVLEQFLGKDVNEVHNKFVSYLENTGFFEDTSKLNLTELSQIMPKITKKIADIESVPLTFRGKMFDINTKNTFQEGERTMVNLVSLTGDKETIPITKEFALWLKYVAKTIENREGRRPSIEEIIKSLKELFTTGEGGISELEFLPY
jgi:hypothetical protein